MKRAILVGTLLSLVTHLVLGWAWTMLAGLVAGFLVERRRWLAGGLAVGLAWGLLIAHSFAVAPAPTWRMITFTGSLFGGLPGPVVPIATVLIGVAFGTVGSLLCTPLLHFWNRARPS